MSKVLHREHRALFLLLSILLFFVLNPFLQDSHTGEGFLVASLYLTLVAATLELAEKKVLFWTALPIAVASMILLFFSHIYFYQVLELRLASSVVLVVFLGLVSTALFIYLLRPGAITTGRLYVSVGLYFLLGLFWYVLYGLVDIIQPGSFAEAHIPLVGRIEPAKLLYFSLATLTTLGYGDIVPLKPAARILAVLEAAAGVLYIAIFVASLVASYQSANHKSAGLMSDERAS